MTDHKSKVEKIPRSSVNYELKDNLVYKKSKVMNYKEGHGVTQKDPKSGRKTSRTLKIFVEKVVRR